MRKAACAKEENLIFLPPSPSYPQTIEASFNCSFIISAGFLFCKHKLRRKKQLHFYCPGKKTQWFGKWSLFTCIVDTGAPVESASPRPPVMLLLWLLAPFHRTSYNSFMAFLKWNRGADNYIKPGWLMLLFFFLNFLKNLF